MKKNIAIISVLVLFIDQLSKYIISYFVDLNTSISIVNKFFYLTNCHNYGAAFSILNNNRIILILFSIIALYIIYRFINNFKINSRNIMAFGLLLGGLFGNLIDRVILGYVRDFFDFYIIKYDYPVFNIADIAIVIGIILLIIAIIKGEDSDGISSTNRRKD